MKEKKTPLNQTDKKIPTDGEKKTSKMMEIVTIKTSKSGGSEFGKMKIPLNQNAGGIGQLSPLVPTQKGIFFRETPSSYNFDVFFFLFLFLFSFFSLLLLLL